MKKKLLEIDRINKFYKIKSKGTVHAVKDLSLSADEGEIIALLGSSGCGKTSILRMLAGFEDISSGNILIEEKRINDIPISARNVAMAFEGYSLYPPLTIFDNMSFALKSQKINSAEIKKKVHEIAELLNITDILENYPSLISAGQQQRASLGRALIRRASIYLLDEPMGQLDPQLRSILRGRIKNYLKTRGMTAILVTHDQSEANAMADRIAVMEDGVLQQYASVKELTRHPSNLFVGTFFGEPPMNIIKAQVVDEEKRVKLIFSREENLSLTYSKDCFQNEILSRILSKDSVDVGVRPHMILAGKGGILLKPESNQWLGDQTQLCFRCAGHLLVMVIDGKSEYGPGQEVALDIPQEALHLFDEDDGSIIYQYSET